MLQRTAVLTSRHVRDSSSLEHDQQLWAAHKVTTEHLNPRFRKCLIWRIWSPSRWELERSACLPACHAHRFPVCMATGHRVALLRHRLGWPGSLPLVVQLRTGEWGAGVSCLYIYRADVCRAPLPGSFWCFTCLPSPSPRSVPGRWGLSLQWMAGAWNPSAEGSRGVRGVPN